MWTERELNLQKERAQEVVPRAVLSNSGQNILLGLRSCRFRGPQDGYLDVAGARALAETLNRLCDTIERKTR
jgi:hypothetical protein